MPVRNEAWVLGLSARVALQWCDALMILVHASTDSTEEIARELSREYPGRVYVMVEPDEKWDEMQHRQRLLEAARRCVATHIAIIDADEILTANLRHDVRAIIASMPRGGFLELPGYNMREGVTQYHENGIWGTRWFTTAFRDQPELHWGGDRFHHREPFGVPYSPWRPIAHGCGGVMHLWGGSERRLRAKHALYKVTETLRWQDKSRADINRMYSLAFDPSLDRRFDQKWSFANVPACWWQGDREWVGKYLKLDEEPWQEAELKRIYEAEPERFRGLDLFGLVPVGASV